jgi:hypothetical protein
MITPLTPEQITQLEEDQTTCEYKSPGSCDNKAAYWYGEQHPTPSGLQARTGYYVCEEHAKKLA